MDAERLAHKANRTDQSSGMQGRFGETGRTELKMKRLDKARKHNNNVFDQINKTERDAL